MTRVYQFYCVYLLQTTFYDILAMDNYLKLFKEVKGPCCDFLPYFSRGASTITLSSTLLFWRR